MLKPITFLYFSAAGLMVFALLDSTNTMRPAEKCNDGLMRRRAAHIYMACPIEALHVKSIIKQSKNAKLRSREALKRAAMY
jgi:hypothetical protein